ncbi:MAG TPA: hypothetical protein VK745_19060 [Polyangiaceae bacterium]|nr:hypothetical protein [Polyangiaceae bacterium]
MKFSSAFFLRRRLLIGFVALVAAASRVGSPKPPQRSVEGLAELLGGTIGGVVKPDEMIWEQSPGALEEMLLGRWVLFLGRGHAGDARDLYRARVRVTFDGQPLSVAAVRNVTDTPVGDDAALEARGDRATFATLAFGRIQGLSVLDLNGIRGTDRPAGFLDRVLLAINSYQDTGSFAGLGRTNIVLDVPAQSAKLTLNPPSLDIDFGENGRGLHYETEQRSLRALDGGEPYAARVVPEVHVPKPLLLWLVDTVRAEVGPEPIAWLENKVFGAKDSIKRASFELFATKQETALKATPTEQVVAKVLDASDFEHAADSWPPPTVPSIWNDPKPGEGEWTPVTYGFLKPMRGLADGAKPPAYFYRTVIRPDPERPYSELVLVAMDMRQLELGMQAGYEDPKPTTGSPGEGHLPQDPAVYSRVVGTFNGAFKTQHGAYGMMVNRRVLLPPVKGGATVIVNDASEVGLGSWPPSDEIPPDILSFRQNLDPLVEDGVANPTGRRLWGWQIEGTSVMTQRTALCVTPAGHLYYAWGEEIDGPTLGKALRQAGCSYAMHLDMNPAHSGFVYTDVVNPKKAEYHLKLADERMTIPPEKFVRWSAKDFFYVMVRDSTPHDPSDATWTADGGAQPTPTWLPGVYSSKLTMGSVDVDLTSFEPGHVEFQFRAGTREPASSSAPGLKTSLDDAAEHRVVAAIGLGHTTDSTRYGFAFGAAATIPLRPGYATLVLAPGKAARLEAPGKAPTIGPDEEAVQLPLLVENGKLEPRARERGDMRRRAALCVTPTDRLIVAAATNDTSDTLAAALLRVGCTRVVELDRGSHHPAFLHRAGTATPPVASYETSVLYALGRPMQPRAFRWKPDNAAPSRKVTSYDYPAPDVKPRKKKHKKDAATEDAAQTAPEN